MSFVRIRRPLEGRGHLVSDKPLGTPSWNPVAFEGQRRLSTVDSAKRGQMVVLWWLVPPLVVTLLAMCWVGWVGRNRDDLRRDDSDAALARMQEALAKPARGASSAPVLRPLEPTHGVALRSGSSTAPASPSRPQR